MDKLQTSTLDSIPRHALDADELVNALQRLPTSKVKILMLDACRNEFVQNPGSRSGDTVVPGLVAVVPEGANAIWYATSPG